MLREVGVDEAYMMTLLEQRRRRRADDLKKAERER